MMTAKNLKQFSQKYNEVYKINYQGTITYWRKLIYQIQMSLKFLTFFSLIFIAFMGLFSNSSSTQLFLGIICLMLYLIQRLINNQITNHFLQYKIDFFDDFFVKNKNGKQIQVFYKDILNIDIKSFFGFRFFTLSTKSIKTTLSTGMIGSHKMLNNIIKIEIIKIHSVEQLNGFIENSIYVEHFVNRYNDKFENQLLSFFMKFFCFPFACSLLVLVSTYIHYQGFSEVLELTIFKSRLIYFAISCNAIFISILGELSNLKSYSKMTHAEKKNFLTDSLMCSKNEIKYDKVFYLSSTIILSFYFVILFL